MSAAPASPSPPLSPDTIHVFTDGACHGNPGFAACAAVLYYNGHVREITRPLGHATNNIAELSAILCALEHIKRRAIPVIVYTDSAYAFGVLTNPSWHPRENLDLIARINRLREKFASLRFVKVPGHRNVPLNRRADALARATLQKMLKDHQASPSST